MLTLFQARTFASVTFGKSLRDTFLKSKRVWRDFEVDPKIRTGG